jgi:signal transduction histidine kinase
MAIAGAALLELRLVPSMSDDAAAPLIVLAVCAPVAGARRYPVAAAVAEGLVVALTPEVQGDFPGAPLLALAAVAYGCGAYAGLRAGAAGVVVLLALMIAASAAAGFPAVLAVLAPWWAGRQVRRRRALVHELAERTDELKAEERAFARLSVQHERARIARELHDIVAHHLAVIVVQAGAGRMSSPASADRARERFANIRQAGDHALAEIARLTDVLHPDDALERPRSLDALIDQAKASGLRLEVTPLPRDLALPAVVEETAYRVVQEALTNAIKHAPGSAVAVRLRVAATVFEIDVRNGGDAAPSSLAASGSGLGLTGMRERIEALGGTLHAGPVADGGWRLLARVPLAEPALSPVR